MGDQQNEKKEMKWDLIAILNPICVAKQNALHNDLYIRDFFKISFWFDKHWTKSNNANATNATFCPRFVKQFKS